MVTKQRAEGVAEEVDTAEQATEEARTGGAGSAVKDGLVRSLRGLEEIEAETIALVRGTASHAIRATGTVAGDAINVTRDVAQGAVQATEAVGTNLIGAAKTVAKDLVSGVSDVGDDLIRAAQELGGNAGALATTAADGTIQAAEHVGRHAVTTLRDLLVATASGVKDVAGTLLPQPREPKHQTEPERTTSEPK